jgi:hypothetical protein
MIMRTINFSSNGNGDPGKDGYIAIDGYSENTVTVYYTDDVSAVISRDNNNVFAIPSNNKIIKNIILEGGLTIITGRKADGSIISLKLSEGNLVFRDAVEGYIPIGTYSEFQLINTTLFDSYYRQEANIDLLNIEWTPIGSCRGTFDGSNYTLANLKISGNNDYVGLFGSGIWDTIRNVHIISGSVSGNNHVGGVCGRSNGTFITACSNTGSVSGKDYVGGVCGMSYGASITACSNTGSVSGNSRVGGVCGYSNNSNSYITSCYNTGSVSGKDYVGGVCGYNYSSTIGSTTYYSYIIACYNTGSVSGNSSVGGVCGYNYFSNTTITACYWQDRSGDNANYGIGYYSNGYGVYGPTNIGTTIFALGAWPTIRTHQQWGIGDGSGDGKYWKSLGGWNGGNPIYPKLWFEE